MKAASLHVFGDVGASIGVIVAGLLILFRGWTIADSLLSVGIAGLIAVEAWRIMRETASILLESVPRNIDMGALIQDLKHMKGVQNVHDLHVWEIASGFPALSAHVLVAADEDCHAARRALQAMLVERFGLTHTTLQVDHAGERLLDIEPMRTQEQADAAPAPQ